MKKLFYAIVLLGISLGMTACNSPHTHTIVNHEAKEPTCTEAGYEEYEECTECDYTTFVKIEALGHELEYCEYDETSCTEEGLEEHWNCYECGVYFIDEEGTQVVCYEDLIIPTIVHTDENEDYICDYGCGEVLFEKEKLQHIIDETLASTKVTVREKYIPGARNTSYYFDENLLHINYENNSEKYYYTEEGTTYLLANLNEWSKEITTEVIKYNISYLFENQFNLEVSSEISLKDCAYGFFEGKTMFRYQNAFGTNVEVKINNEATLLEGVYICDENNNIIYMFEMIYGENEEIISGFETRINSFEDNHIADTTR